MSSVEQKDQVCSDVLLLFPHPHRGARLFRLDMETYAAGDEALQWCWPDCNVDSKYLNDLDTIVTWVANKHPGVQLGAGQVSKRGS